MSNYTLKDYEELAYEFAIRNPRVVEILNRELSTESQEELLTTYGIDTADDLLYCEYNHLPYIVEAAEEKKKERKESLIKRMKSIEKKETNNHTALEKLVLSIDPYKKHYTPLCFRVLVRPRPEGDYSTEYRDEALERIKSNNTELIRELNGKLKRLMNNDIFDNYDAYVFEKKSYVMISGSNSKGVRNDILFVEKWIQPENYLTLLPSNIKTTYI